MKKDVAQMFKLGAVLACFASVACVLLALVNSVTSPRIEQIKANELKSGLQEIFADAQDFSIPQGFSKETINGVSVEQAFLAKDKNGNVIGCAVQATGPTYDKATILTGVGIDGYIKAIKILSISDTSGFGQNATKPEFYTQFAGKSINDPFNPEKGGDIDGLSGATITRRGVARILKVSTDTAKSILAEAEKGSSK